jgi:sialate O-acetylesterase
MNSRDHCPTQVKWQTWKNADLDDNKWPQMQLPSLWEEKQLGELDGVVWFRKTIDISTEDVGKGAILELAMIDDNDITYVNGVEVGKTNSYNTHRNYSIPAGILKAGKNIIAVRVDDTGGGGGIYGEAGDMKLTIGNHVISLAGDWRFRVESVEGDVSSVGPTSIQHYYLTRW